VAASKHHDSDDEENIWKCLNCTMHNAISTKRCEACGEPQHAAVTSRSDTHDQKSESDEEKTDYYHSHGKVKAKGLSKNYISLSHLMQHFQFFIIHFSEKHITPKCPFFY
jgi:hypothetical protein